MTDPTRPSDVDGAGSRGVDVFDDFQERAAHAVMV